MIQRLKEINQKRIAALLAFLMAAALLLSSCGIEIVPMDESPISLEDVPAYSGDPYVPINNNQPYFTPEEITTEVFEEYSPLDALNRCGVAYANICHELMPTEPRQDIGMIRPTGWQTARYEGLVDGTYLYNRCHLIGFQLAGENANECNLITGTRYMNVVGMLPFEDMVDDYVDETDNHVLYRVTPIFVDDEMVARGVLMEGYSVEDEGDGICFNVYVYNVQPGVEIDYATGDNWLAETGSDDGESETYILNTSSKKFHLPGCSGADSMNPENRQEFTGDRDMLIAQGYKPCGKCNP